MKNLFPLLLVMMSSFRLISPGPTFTKKGMGEAWPFRTIQAGTVRCISGAYIVLVATNGKTYALNGIAGSVARDRGWKKLDGEQIIGKDISSILDAGKKLCQ